MVLQRGRRMSSRRLRYLSRSKRKGKIVEVADAGRLGHRRRASPDGKWEAFVKDHKLFVRDKASSEEFVLGDDGTEDDSYEERILLVT